MRRAILLGLAASVAACGARDQPPAPAEVPMAAELRSAPNFGEDVTFLRLHTEIILLVAPDERAQVAVAPGFQGRVMTSTADGASGTSFGYIHRPVVELGQRQPHMTVLGGEDRFWLGPEGGQFGLYFAPGAAFDAEHWQVPEAIDWGPWAVTRESDSDVAFSQPVTVTNYAGTRLAMRVDRTVRLLGRDATMEALGQAPGPATNVVAYESDNRITNTGRAAWTKATGMPSIWILGMFTPAPRTTVVLPFVPGTEAERGPVVNDAYFGRIPANRLAVGESAVFLRGDGRERGKIGIPRPRARDVAGSYDPDRHVLTIVRFTLPADARDYVNSMWAHQPEPFRGDVVNSYNDGPLGPGLPPLGPFYEIESSSPAAALAPNASLRHVHRTLHLQGPDAELDVIAKAVLGVSLAEITGSLP